MVFHVHEHEVVTTRCQLVGLAGFDYQWARHFLHLAIDSLMHLVHLGIEAGGKSSDGDVRIGMVDQGAKDGGHVLVLIGAHDGIVKGQFFRFRSGGCFPDTSGSIRLRLGGIILVLW